MDDVLIDIGLKLMSSPWAWAIAAAPPVVAIGLGWKAVESDWSKQAKTVAVVAVVLFVLITLPTVLGAYFEARDACREGRVTLAEQLSMCPGIPGV